MLFDSEKKRIVRSRLLSFMGITVLTLTIASVSFPNLLRSRVAANEATAVGSIRTLNSALATYSEQHPDQGYPQNLSDLAPYVDSNLAEGMKSGYSFRYLPQRTGWDSTVTAFRLEAAPLSTDTGVRLFSSNESGAIRYQASSTQSERLLEGASPQPPRPRANSPRMMRKASLNLIVSEPFVVGEKIRTLAYRLGGFVESVRSQDDAGGARQTSVVIRVPADRLEEARRAVRNLGGRVRNEQEDSRDVTAQYVDLDSNLRNYRAEEAQYLEIMRRSGTIKDTLAVSERLADARGRIERTQGQLNQLTHQTEMALLEVCLRTEATTQAPDVRWHPALEIKAAFWSAADDLSTYANFMITVLLRLPVFALWTCTILTSFLGGWRLLRWTWKRFAPSPLTAG